MSFLDRVIKGKLDKPQLVLLYGPDGIGKTSFGADAPNPIFLGAEDGTANLDVARFPAPTCYGDILDSIKELIEEKHEYKSLVIDSLDWLEPLVWNQVCKDGQKKKIEDFGYGKGYANALEEWRKMISLLDTLRATRKTNIILIAHSQVKTFHDPSQLEGYDRYQLKLNEKASALFREFVDSVLFANYETFLKSNDQKKVKGLGDGSRKIYTQRRPAFDAKNRAGLPFELPLSWESFYEACQSGNPKEINTVRENINSLLENILDETLKGKVIASVEAAKDDNQKLLKIEDKLKTLITA